MPTDNRPLSEDEIEFLMHFRRLDDLQQQAFAFIMESMVNGDTSLESLSELSLLDYYRLREGAAKRLGLSVAVLDVAVNMWDSTKSREKEETR